MRGAPCDLALQMRGAPCDVALLMRGALCDVALPPHINGEPCHVDPQVRPHSLDGDPLRRTPPGSHEILTEAPKIQINHSMRVCERGFLSGSLLEYISGFFWLSIPFFLIFPGFHNFAETRKNKSHGKPENSYIPRKTGKGPPLTTPGT